MSLSRVSYLESWEHHPPPFLRRSSPGDVGSEDEGSVGPRSLENPEAALFSSSLPSSFPVHVVHRKLSFNPYAGRGWTQSSASAAEEERRSLLHSEFGSGTNISDLPSTRHAAESVTTEGALRDSNVNFASTTPAFEVSKAKRIAQVSAAVLYCLFAAGPVFGFAAIKPVFIREGVYRDQCTRQELDNASGLCYGQETRLNLMFTIAAVATNICALPVGTVLDTYGPRVSGIIGSILIASGALCLALAAHLPFDGYIPGYLFLALGGPFVFISSFQLSNTFPARSGLILSLLTGAFDASSALFLIFRLVHEKTDGGFSIQKFFSVYLIVPVLILLVQIVLMPHTSYKTAGELVLQAEQKITEEVNDTVDTSVEDVGEAERQRRGRRAHRQIVVSNIQDLLDESTSHRKIDDLIFDENDPEFASRRRDIAAQTPEPSSIKPDDKHVAGGVWGVMHGASAFQQIRSPWFILITLFTVLQMLRINYFVATIWSQYDYLLSSPELARQLNEFFDLALPVGGLIAIPFIGVFLDSATTPVVLFILVSVSTAIGILGCIPGSLGAGYANIVLFVVYRPFYYTTVSDYVAKVFGFQTFGKVYGLVIALAGVCNFAQTGLDALTFKIFHRNPTPGNIVLTVSVVLVGIALVSYVSAKARTLPKSQVDLAAAEQQPLVSDAATEGQNGRSYGTV